MMPGMTGRHADLVMGLKDQKTIASPKTAIQRFMIWMIW